MGIDALLLSPWHRTSKQLRFWESASWLAFPVFGLSKTRAEKHTQEKHTLERGGELHFSGGVTGERVLPGGHRRTRRTPNTMVKKDSTCTTITKGGCCPQPTSPQNRQPPRVGAVVAWCFLAFRRKLLYLLCLAPFRRQAR